MTARPHEALGQTPPANLYRKSTRRWSKRYFNYPNEWPRWQVRSNGEIKWQGRKRFIGEAFVKQQIGLKPFQKGVQVVYFGPLLIGHLHDEDPGAMRLVVYQRRVTVAQKLKLSPMS